MADVEAAQVPASPTSTPGSRTPPRPRPSWFRGLQDDIDAAYSDVPVLICCALSALCDTVAFNAAGVFVSMQTGESDGDIVEYASESTDRLQETRYSWLSAPQVCLQDSPSSGSSRSALLSPSGWAALPSHSCAACGRCASRPWPRRS